MKEIKELFKDIGTPAQVAGELLAWSGLVFMLFMISVIF